MASLLNNVTKTSTESGAGQNDDNLAVVEETFDLLAQSNVNEQVCDRVCVCVHVLSLLYMYNNNNIIYCSIYPKHLPSSCTCRLWRILLVFWTTCPTGREMYYRRGAQSETPTVCVFHLDTDRTCGGIIWHG